MASAVRATGEIGLVAARSEQRQIPIAGAGRLGERRLMAGSGGEAFDRFFRQGPRLLGTFHGLVVVAARATHGPA